MAVSDLCIGKPALRSLQSSATVGETLIALKRSGGGASVGVWSSPEKKEVAGKVSMVDVLCFLCAEKNISSPSAALDAPVSALLSSSDAAIRRVEPHSSILEALEVILDGAKSLVVPIRSTRKKLAGAGAGAGGGSDLCWLTAEDFVRFFLNSIALFSPLPSLSISTLGIVRPAALAIGYHEPALSAVPLLGAAVADQTSVAVVSDDGRLLGEISPSTLVYCDESAAAAIAALSAGELMAYVDFSTAPPEAAIHAVKARLTERGLLGMLDFLDADSSSSSLSDEEPAPRKRIRATRSGSYSARMGRRTEEAIVCHPRSSLMAVMIQALAHRVSYVWVVDDDYALLGIVGLADMLSVFREQFNGPIFNN